MHGMFIEKFVTETLKVGHVIENMVAAQISLAYWTVHTGGHTSGQTQNQDACKTFELKTRLTNLLTVMQV